MLKLNPSATLKPMHPKLSTFLATGDIPTTSKERNLLLDLARLELAQKNKTNQTTNMQIFNKTILNNMTPAERAAEQSKRTTQVIIAKQQLADVRATHAADFAEAARLKGQLAISAAKAGKTPAPIHRAVTATASTTAKPTPAPRAPGLTTAASFATAPLVMAHAEFSKLTPADKSKFSKQGGKLI